MNDKIKMSPFQQNIWNLRTAMEDTAVCNVGGYFFSTEMVDYVIWQEVMRNVIQTASVLRLQIDKFGNLYETLYTDYQLPHQDRRGVDSDEIIKEMEMWMQAPMQDIDAPLYDCRFVQADEGIYMFGRFSHLIMDGLSFAHLMKRQENYYMQIWENGKADAKADTGFVEELKKVNTMQEETEAYVWYQQIWKEPVKANCYLDEEKSLKAHSLKMDLTEDQTKHLREFAKTQRVTVESLAFAAIALVLREFTGQDTVVVGRSVLNRSLNQMKQMGMYANTQPVRLEMKECPKQFVEKVAKLLRQQLRYTAYSFSKWKSDFQIDGTVFDAVISYRNHKILPRMQRSQVRELFNGYLEVPLRVNWNEEERGTEIELQYSLSGWNRKDAERFLKRVVNAIKILLDENVQKLETIKVSCEEDEIIKKSMAGQVWEYQKSVVEQFWKSMETRKEEIVLTDKDRTMIGKEVIAECVQMIKMLEKERFALATGNMIGVLAKRSIHLPILVMAILTSGNVYFPMDARDDQERLKYLSGFCAKVITDEELMQSLAEFNEGDFNEQIRFLNEKCKNIQKEMNAYAISTSGTTGSPKIVLNTHNGLSCRLAWMNDFYGVGGKYLQKTRKTFDVSLWELILPLIDGGQMYVLQDGREADVELISNVLEEVGIEKVHFVPSVYKIFLDYVKQKGKKYPKLKKVFLSGEALSEVLVKKSKEILPQTDIINLYGPAECSIDVSHYTCNADEVKIPIGKPVYGTELYILNGEKKEVPVGGTGEICIVGEQVGHGYLDGTASEADQNRFFTFRGKPAYMTGDKGRFDENGLLYYLGRKDAQVKINGVRMNLTEIERAVLTCDGIEEVAVCNINNRIAVFYTAQREIEETYLKKELRKKLSYYSIPEYFLKLDKFPIGKHGKIDRKELKLPQMNKAVETEGDVDGLDHLLRPYVKLDNIERNVSIFDMGLTSIGAAEYSLALMNAGYDISYQELYQGQTLEGIAQIIQKKSKGCFESGLVTILGNGTGSEEVTDLLVCFPYAGGGAECFTELKKGIKKKSIAVWSVNLNNYYEEGFDEIADKLWKMIPENVKVHSLGYCVGSVPALAFIKAAKNQRRNVSSLCLCGAYPYKSIRFAKKEYAIWDFIPYRVGKMILENIYEGRLPFDEKKYDQFRKEVRKAQIYMRQYRENHTIPTTLVYANRDVLTPFYRFTYKSYCKYINNELHVHQIKNEGHYFMSKQGKLIGEWFENNLD